MSVKNTSKIKLNIKRETNHNKYPDQTCPETNKCIFVLSLLSVNVWKYLPKRFQNVEMKKAGCDPTSQPKTCVFVDFSKCNYTTKTVIGSVQGTRNRIWKNTKQGV